MIVRVHSGRRRLGSKGDMGALAAVPRRVSGESLRDSRRDVLLRLVRSSMEVNGQKVDGLFEEARRLLGDLF